MTVLLALIAALPFALGCPEPAHAPDTPAGEQLEWFLAALAGEDPGDIEARFHSSFNEQVPPAQLKATLTRIGAMGPFTLVAIESRDDPMSLRAILYAENADANFRVLINIDEPTGRVTGLLIQPAPDFGAQPITTWEEFDELLAELPGRVSFGVYELIDGRPDAVHEYNADVALPIGSTFKLWILGALGELVLEGQASWDEPLAIDDSLKSLPSGEMQVYDAGTEFPISEFADKMISISDNTATDHLLARIGRERVEGYMSRFVADPAPNKPLIGTYEMFALKLGGNGELLLRYAGADEAERRELLDGPVAKTTPIQVLILAWKRPIEIERVEWFAGARDLAATMADLRRLEQIDGLGPLGRALRINAGIAFDREVWTGIAFKGGSEPGVINMTWMVERDDGRWFVLSLGWADTESAVALEQAVRLATRGFGLTADQRR